MIKLILRVFLLILALIPILVTRASIAQDTNPDDLHNLINDLFPGNSTITIDGAFTTLTDAVCPDAVAFPIPRRYQLPQGYIVPEDRGPERAPMFANTLVNDPDVEEIVLPASISIDIVEPDIASEDVVPVMKYGFSPETSRPWAAVGVDVVKGESYGEVETFDLNPNGDTLFRFEAQEGGLVEARRVAFDFTVENQYSQQMHVRGGIHGVIIPWYLTYTALRDEQSSFVVLSGIAYGIGEPDTIQAELRDLDGVIQYTIQLETMVVLKDTPEAPAVPLIVSFTAIQDEDDAPFGGEVLSFEVTVNGVLMEDFTATLKRHLSVLVFVRNDETLSGEARLAFSNGCGGYLQMDLLFRDIPITKSS